MLNLVIPTSGSIYYNGHNVLGDYTYKHDWGYMPQIGRYPENMSVQQLFSTVKKIREIPENLLDYELYNAFKLDAIQHKKLGTLSGGTKQKVSAALTFLFKPQVVILDEPTAGLDPLASELLKNKIIKEVNDTKIVIITSHILSELNDLISHVAYLHDGQLQFFESLKLILEKTNQKTLSEAIISLLKQRNNE